MASNLKLLDTSAWILVLRKGGPIALKRRIEDWSRRDLIVTTDPVIIELLQGTRSEEEYARLSAELDSIPSLPVDARIWQRVRRNSFTLARKGVVTSLSDMLISSVAIEHTCELVHRDADFKHIASVLPLRQLAFM